MITLAQFLGMLWLASLMTAIVCRSIRIFYVPTLFTLWTLIICGALSIIRGGP